MKIDSRRFEMVLRELIDENALACQGILSILRIEYTDQVPTLAVSLEEKPRLLVNLDFLNQHASKEVHIKTVLLHEFLHVLLNHTEQFKKMDAATNLALDAIINHIIHRAQGADYSEFFRFYYRDQQGYASLLQPIATSLTNNDPLRWVRHSLLEGKIVVDDLLELVQDMHNNKHGIRSPSFALSGGKSFLGNHDAPQRNQDLPEVVREALRETLKSLNGNGIYRAPKAHGFGANPYPERLVGKSENLRRWEQSTGHILKKLCTPDPRSTLSETTERTVILPVLNEGDRRAFLKTLWSPLLPDVGWTVSEKRPTGTTAIYLDVSGSMASEMQALVHLLWRVRRYIRMPFWAFSDQVAPATIRHGVLETQTSGGTSMNSVLSHFAQGKVERAVVITDGYIEKCDPDVLRTIGTKKLHAIVSRDGSTRELERAGIPAYQLEKYPADLSARNRS